MATPFIATVAIGTALDLRGFSTGVAKLRSAASAANGPMGQTQGAAGGLSRALGAAAFNANALGVAARVAVGGVAALGTHDHRRRTHRLGGRAGDGFDGHLHSQGRVRLA